MILAVLGCTAVALSGIAALGWWVQRWLIVVTVEGPSMEPTLWHGDRVLVRRKPLAAVRTGQLVVVRRPQRVDPEGAPRRWLIKRAVAIPGEPVPADVRASVGGADILVPPGHLVVIGDNRPHSGDSRQWGYVTEDRLLGVVSRSMSRRAPVHQ